MKPHHALIVSGIFLLILPFIVSRASANWLVTGEGKVIWQSNGQVLGQEDAPGLQNKSQGNSGTEESAATNRGQTQKIQRTLEGQTGKFLKIKPAGNMVEVEDETGTQTENELDLDEPSGTPSGSVEIEEPQGKDHTKVRAQNNAAYVIRNKIAAQTHFPLMVNLETNELIVTTPKGSKVVTVLPDAAVQHMLAANVLDQLGGKGGLRWLEYQKTVATPSAAPVATISATPAASPSGKLSPTPEITETPGPEPSEPASPSATPEPSPTPPPSENVDNVVILTADQDGTLVYEIQGSKNKKLIGFIPVEIQRTAIVSAETGELIKIQEDFKNRLLDLLSV